MAFVVLNCKRGLLRQRVIGVHFISIFVIVAFIHISSISSTSSSFDDGENTCSSSDCSSLVPNTIESSYSEIPQNVSKPCIPIDFGQGSVVCVCNATYCDELEPIVQLPKNSYYVYTTSKSGQRFYKVLRQMTNEKPANAELFILDPTVTFQDIVGFGGSFTDATGININSLTTDAKKNLLRSYFSETGIEYNLCRVPIGGSDFSPRGYTYNDGHNGDFELNHFQLQPEDLNYKIPLILEAQNISCHPMKLLASPWSPPVWMKTNDALNGTGQLRGEPGGIYYKTWAKYLIRFLQEYANYDVDFWAITSQNEPIFAGFDRFMQIINNLDFPVNNLREFIVQDLGPALNASDFGHVKLLTYDEILLFAPFIIRELMKKDSAIHDYVSGIAFHWYENKAVNPEVITGIHETYPEMILLSTEACEGVGPQTQHVILGSWERAENYAFDILKDLLHWTSGWIDWNMALDLIGGPNWNGNLVDSPIIVDAEEDRFYKQPMFYIMGHFSKFIPPDSKVIKIVTDCKETKLMAVAVTTPQNSIAVVILNRWDEAKEIAIEYNSKYIHGIIPAKSIQTYLWW